MRLSVGARTSKQYLNKMLTLKILAIFVIIFSCDAYKIYNKTHYVFLDEWGTIDAKSKDGRVMYSNCTNKGSVVKNCTVVVEKTAYSNDSYACDISLKSEHAKGNVGKKMKLLGGLGDDKVLFFWQENNKRRGRYFTYGILNMEDCKFTTAKLDKRSMHRKTAVVMYDDSFDVFFKNKTVCGEKICRITFDDEGNVLKEAHSYMEGGTLNEKDGILRPISNKSPNAGHFYVRVEEGNSLNKSNFTTTYYLLKNGNEKLLKRLDGRPKVSISTAHNIITACASYKKNNGHIDCTKFDTKGNVLSATTLSSNDNKKKKVLSVQNEADGSILVLYETNELSGEAASHVTLAKFDSNGKILRSRIIKDYCGESLNMSEDEEGNYCIVNGCTKEPDNMWGDKEMNFSYQCFNDYDLY